MSRQRLGDGLLNLALVGGGLLVLVLLYGFAARALTPRTTPTRAADDFGRIKVEVRNAAGADGVAAAATAHLRRRGFDVVGVGNAERRATSGVLVRAGTVDDARHVAGAVGLGPSAVEAGGPTNDYALDVTLYLGADYGALAPFRDAPPPDQASD